MPEESGGFPLDWEYYNERDIEEPITEEREVDYGVPFGDEPEEM